jgi:hypothetical protein
MDYYNKLLYLRKTIISANHEFVFDVSTFTLIYSAIMLFQATKNLIHQISMLILST